MNMGTALANKIKDSLPNHDIDVVVPIPDTSRISALELSAKLKIPFREGFIKNRYIGRTFIMSQQNERSKSVKRKLNAVKSEFLDKTVLLVDDSIVRGTTSNRLLTWHVKQVQRKFIWPQQHHQLNTQMFMVLTCQRAKNLLQTMNCR